MRKVGLSLWFVFVLDYGKGGAAFLSHMLVIKRLGAGLDGKRVHRDWDHSWGISSQVAVINWGSLSGDGRVNDRYLHASLDDTWQRKQIDGCA